MGDFCALAPFTSPLRSPKRPVAPGAATMQAFRKTANPNPIRVRAVTVMGDKRTCFMVRGSGGRGTEPPSYLHHGCFRRALEEVAPLVPVENRACPGLGFNVKLTCPNPSGQSHVNAIGADSCPKQGSFLHFPDPAKGHHQPRKWGSRFFFESPTTNCKLHPANPAACGS